MNLELLAALAPDADARQAFFGMAFAFFSLGVAVLLIFSLLGILFLTLAIAPGATQRFSSALRERNLLSFFAGIPVLAAFGFGGALLRNHPAPSFVLLILFGITLLLAFAAAAEDIGRRLYWATGKEGSRAAHLAAGWIVFAFGALFPIVGWFLVLPYVSLSGLGSLVVGFCCPRAAGSAPPEAGRP
jgi:hypothetical protein